MLFSLKNVFAKYRLDWQFLGIASCFLFFSCKSKLEQTNPKAEKITESVYASGVVKSSNQYQVFSSVNGLVQEKLVTEGDTVKKGDAILRIKNETAQLQTENAGLAAQYSTVGANQEKINEAQQNINFTKNKLHNDSQLLYRQKRLWQEGIGTRNELDLRELTYKNSLSNYKSSVLQLADLQKKLQFAAKQSQKNLEISTVNTKDYTIKSQVNGRVYSILKEKGEMVSPQSPVAIIGDANAFTLELQVDEYDIAKIKKGQKILLHFDSYKGAVFEAEVAKINPIMNERSRTFTVDADFTKRPETLYPNLTLEANIVLQTKEKALLIPRNYLIGDKYVLLKKGEKSLGQGQVFSCQIEIK